MKTETLQISGMECEKCRERIEKALLETQGIKAAQVSYANANALVTYDENIVSHNSLVSIITDCGYEVLKNGASSKSQAFVAYALFVAALYLLYQHLGVSQAANALPVVGSGMSYAALFVIGLFTSVHCVAMCGGINLSQTISVSAVKRPLFPAFLYNGGRVISYTLTGIIVGALGQVITFSPFMQGALQIFAGIFMLLMAVNMMGFFKPLRAIQSFLMPRLPKKLNEKIFKPGTKNRGPLVVGLLNGLMPCGPLQAMQLYALSTASPISGGISMFIFSMGTVPLMFFVGAIGSLLNMKFKERVMKAGSVFVAVLGLAMFTNGYALSGLPLMGNITLSGNTDRAGILPAVKDGVQIIESTLSGGRYPAITVQQGIPVHWIINAPQGSINGCNNRMIIREYGITHTFKPGENVIEFMPYSRMIILLLHPLILPCGALIIQ